MASGQRPQQHVLLTHLLLVGVVAVLGTAVARDGAKHVQEEGEVVRRAGGGDGEDDSPPAVGEVFGRSAVIGADESRRIYAISIPRLYQDEHTQGGSVEESYHPPVYRPQPGGGGLRPGDSRRSPPPYSGGGGLPPASYTASHSSPHPHWKSGLRLIVSGPADDNPSKNYPAQATASYEYDHSPESFRSDLNYRSPYENNSPMDAAPSYEREHTRDSHHSRNRDFIEPHDRDRSPLWEDYPTYQEGHEYRETNVQQHPRESTAYEEKDDRRRFPNSPYHKLPEPYSVGDEPPKVERPKDPEPIPPVFHEGERSESFNKGNVNSEQHSAVGDARGLNNPQEYYDSLYEEFMETAYDDYHDHLPTDAAEIEPQIGSDLSPPPPPSFSKSSSETQSDQMTSSPRRSLQKSETRRDPPSDMYTTSRSTVQPKSLLLGVHDEDAGSGKDLPQRDSFLKEDLRSQDDEQEEGGAEEEILPLPASSSVPVVPPPQLTSSDEVPILQDPSPETPAKRVPSSTPLVPEGSPSPSSEPPSSSPTDDIEIVTTQRSQIPKPTHAYKHRPSASLISLSEILQGIGVSLPQFLVQLKMHGSDLKAFTNKLERRALTKIAFKRAQGNVGELLKILDEDIEGAESSLQLTSSTASPYTTVKPSFKMLSNGFTKKTTAVAEAPETTTTSSSTTQRTTTTTKATTTTSSPTTTKRALSPKMFGFKPSATVKSDGVETAVANISVTNSTLGGVGNATSTSTSDNTGTTESSSDVVVGGTSSEEEKPSVYRPYKPDNGGWRERMVHNRGVSSRLGTTTRRPTVRPPYQYYGGNQDLTDLIQQQDGSSEEGTREVVQIDVVDLETSPGSSQSSGIGLLNGDSNVVGLTEGTLLGGSYDHPRYDRDPNSLNIATRSAIMAAGVLGGIALAVFVTILIFVMYRNHVGKRRLRVPFPLSVASDESTSSTPPLYSSRSRSGIGTRSSTHTDFWGTLKRKFDPYSLSSTSASYY